MPDPLQKIQALLALAAASDLDDKTNEARNASYAAVRLMRQHRIVLSTPTTQKGAAFPVPSVHVKAPTPARARPAKTQDDGWRKMKAKFEGHCKWCNEAVKPNAPIYWSKDHGAYHAACYFDSQG
jgi:hypothetical protein